MTRSSQQLRLGILWRGGRSELRPAPSRGLDALFDAFAELPAEIVPVPFEDVRVEEVRARLDGLDGLLAWVNPIQDGASRANVDELLRQASARGVFVSADPAVILKMGTKEVLYTTRELGWGSDTDLYRSSSELAERFPARLSRHRRLVVKQGRGNGGNGVWKVEAPGPDALTPDSPVRVQNALLQDGSSEQIPLGEFFSHCDGYFAWSGVVVDQVFQDRLSEGMVRCYFSHGEVIGFARQWPRGLLDIDPAAPPPERTREPMEGPDAPAYQPLRELAEKEWVPAMATLLDLGTTALPVVWDADFLFGPRDGAGRDTYVLCEINVSAVWPFPSTGSPTVAANALARTAERSGR